MKRTRPQTRTNTNTRRRSSMAKLMKIDGTVKDLGETGLSLAAKQKLVGGYIEVVTLNDDGMVLVINEEGKLREMERNDEATKLALNNQAIFEGDYIAGDAILCQITGTGTDKEKWA